MQTSFALGGPAFNIQEARAEAIEATMGPNAGKHLRMATIEPVRSTRLQDSGEKGARGGSRAGRGGPGGRNHPQLIQTLQTNVQEGATRQVGTTPLSAAHAGGQPTTFENYISKVVGSVQARKKNPRLKSLFNQGSHQNSLDQYATALDPLGDYGGSNLNKDGRNESQLITQSILHHNLQQPHHAHNVTGALSAQNYDDQSLSAAGSQLTRGTRGNQYRDSVMTAGPAESQFDKKTAVSAAPKSQTTQVSLLGNRQVAQKEPKATEQVAYLLRQIQKRG